MNKLSKFLIIIISLIIIIISISYVFYPWFKGDYLFAITLIGVLGFFYGIFNLYDIKLWKKILYTIIASLISVFVLIYFIVFFSSIIQGPGISSGLFPG